MARVSLVSGVWHVRTSTWGRRASRLATGQLAAGGIDVFEEEPTPLDNPILNLPNVIVSPHAAGVTREANRQTGVQVSEEMLRVLRGERPDVLVNPDVAARLGLR